MPGVIAVPMPIPNRMDAVASINIGVNKAIIVMATTHMRIPNSTTVFRPILSDREPAGTRNNAELIYMRVIIIPASAVLEEAVLISSMYCGM